MTRFRKPSGGLVLLVLASCAVPAQSEGRDSFSLSVSPAVSINDSDYYSSDLLPEGGKGWRKRRVGARRRMNSLPNA